MTTAAPAGPDTGELAGRLRIAAGRIARDGLGQKQVDGMTPSRITALAVLAAEGPLRMGELADALNAADSGHCPGDRARGPLSTTSAAVRRVRAAAVREHGESLLAERIGARRRRPAPPLCGALPVRNLT